MKTPYRVSKQLRWGVFIRDGGCVLRKLQPEHVCKDIWGQEHAWNDLERLSLEHVKSDLRMGVRAPNDEAHLVALCGYANVNVPSKAQRALFREYLAKVAA